MPPPPSLIRGRLLLILAAVLWSTSGVVLKSPPLAELPLSMRGTVLACYRALFAFVFLVPFVPRRAVRWRPMLIPMVVCFAVMNLLYITAMTRTTAAAAIFLQYTSSVWAFVFGLFFLKEGIDRGNLVALLFAVCGIGWIVAGDWGNENFVGNLLALGAGFTYAGVILCLRVLREENSAWLICLNHLVGGVALLPFVWQADPTELRLVQWVLIAALGVTSMSLPYVIFATAIRSVRTQEAGLLLLLEPVLNPIWVWLFWREENNPAVLVGGGLILLGLALRYLLFPTRAAAAASIAPPKEVFSRNGSDLMKVRWPCLLLALILAGNSSSLHAEPPVFEFVEGLRNRGYFDTVEEYLDRVEKNPDVSAETKKRIPYERAITLRRSIGTIKIAKLRHKQLDRAAAYLEQFLKANPNHPLAGNAKTERGDIFIGKAEVDTVELRKPGTPEQKAELRKQALSNINKARQAFKSALPAFKAHLESFGTFIPREERERRRQRALAEQRYIMTEINLARCTYTEAHVYDKKDLQFKTLLTQAFKEFGDIHGRYRSLGWGLYARMWQGKCFEEQGEIGRALGIYGELLSHKGTSSLMQTIQRDALYFKLICLNHESKKDHQLVEIEATEWWKRNARYRTTATGLGLKYELAKARKILGTVSEQIPAKDKPKYLTLAKADAEFVAKYEGKHRLQAAMLLEQIKRLRGDKTVDPKNFNDAFTRSMVVYQNIKPQLTAYNNAVAAGKPQADIDRLKAGLKNEVDETERLSRLTQRLYQPGDDINRLNESRLSLAYTAYLQDQYFARQDRVYDGAVLSEFVARHAKDENPEQAMDAAHLAMSLYIRAYNAAPLGRRQTEIRWILRSGKYLVENWPGTKRAAEASLNIGKLYDKRGEPLAAAHWYLRVPPSAKDYYAQAQILAGRAFWTQFRIASGIKPERPAQLAALQKKTDDALLIGVANLMNPTWRKREALERERDELLAELKEKTPQPEAKQPPAGKKPAAKKPAAKKAPAGKKKPKAAPGKKPAKAPAKKKSAPKAKPATSPQIAALEKQIAALRQTSVTELKAALTGFPSLAPASYAAFPEVELRKTLMSQLKKLGETDVRRRHDAALAKLGPQELNTFFNTDLDDWKESSAKSLLVGIEQLSAEMPATNPSVDDLTDLVLAKVTLAHYYRTRGTYDKIISLLTAEPHSVVSAIAVADEKKRPADGIKGRPFASSVFQQLLRAYVGTQNIDAALKTMDTLEATVSAEQAENITDIYESLGRELQREIERLRNRNDQERLDEVRGSFKRFLAELFKRKDALKYSTLIWIGETYYSLGEGLGDDPEAANYFENAFEAYSRILDEPSLDEPRRLTVKIRQVRCKRRQQEYSEGVTIVQDVLGKKPNLLSAQFEAAYTLQKWGASGEQAKFLQAIAGIEKTPLWGWLGASRKLKRLVDRTDLKPEDRANYEQKLLEARYNMSWSRYQYGLALSSDKTDKNRAAALSHALAEIADFALGFDGIDGKTFKDDATGSMVNAKKRFDELYEKIQVDMGRSGDQIVKIDWPKPQPKVDVPIAAVPAKADGTGTQTADADPKKKAVKSKEASGPGWLAIIGGGLMAVLLFAGGGWFLMNMSKQQKNRRNLLPENETVTTLRKTALIAIAVFTTTTIARAADIITVRNAEKRLSGEIDKITKTTISIKTGLRKDKLETVKVNDVVHIKWDREPARVEGLRNAEADNRLQQALDGYKEILADPKVTNENLKTDLKYFIARTTAKIAQGDPTKAADAITKLEAFRKSNSSSYHYYESLMYLGHVFKAKKDFDQAIASYRLVGQAPWEDYQLAARNAEAAVMLEKKQPAAALTIYTDVLSKAGSSTVMKPIATDALLGKAACLQQTGKNKEAIAELNNIINNAAKTDNHMLAGAYVLQGDCYLALNQKKDALLSYLHVDVLFESQREYHPRALYHLSRLWKEVDKADRARAAKEKLDSKTMLNGKFHAPGTTRNWCFLLMLVMLAYFVSATVTTTTSVGTTTAVAAEGDETPAEEESSEKGESFLMWLIRANGLFFGPVFLLLSFVMIALVIMNILQVRRDVLLPAVFIEAFEQRLAAKDYQGAYETAKGDGSFVAQVLAAGLSKLGRGYNEAIEGMQEVGEDENMALEHRLSYLSLIGAIAPMDQTMKFRHSGGENDKIEAQMAPMIDVVFQLLIFFMLTLKIIEPEGDFSVNMPQGRPQETNANEPHIDPKIVDMQMKPDGTLGSLKIGGKQFTIRKATDGAKIQQYIKLNPKALLTPDQAAWRIGEDIAFAQLTDEIEKWVRTQRQAFPTGSKAEKEDFEKKLKVKLRFPYKLHNRYIIKATIEMGGNEEETGTVDVEAAIDTALTAFEDGIFLVAIDGRQYRSLDEPVALLPDSRLLASVIESGGKEADTVFDILTATARNEHEIGGFGGHVINGLLLASREAGWELIEKTLLAAQRQEGLRQSILECVQSAHPEAFRRMLRLIVDNKLARFSAVVRAADVWFQLGWDSLTVKQINSALETALLFLENEKQRRQALAGDDPDQLYLALWAVAFTDAPASIAPALKQRSHQSAEIRYVAALHLSRLGLRDADYARLQFFDDEDIRVALCAAQGLGLGYYGENLPKHDDLFDRLETLFERLPKKPTTLKPIVWPWTERKAGQNDVAEMLVHALNDRPPTRLIPYLRALDTYSRRGVVEHLARQKKWDALTRDTLIGLVGDPSADVRSAAFDALSRKKLKPAEIERLEAFLTRKSADLRLGIVQLLQDQKDPVALSSAERLLAGKTAPLRLAGLELLRQMAEDKRAADVCRELATDYESSRKKISREERTQLEAIAESGAEKLTLDDALGLMDPADRTPVAKPRNRRVPLITNAAIKCLQSLDDLIHKHRETEIEVESNYDDDEPRQLLGNVGWRFPYVNREETRKVNIKRLPLSEIWMDWYENRPKSLRDRDGFEMLRAELYYDFAFSSWRFNNNIEWVAQSTEARLPLLKTIWNTNENLELRYGDVIERLLSWFEFLKPPAGAVGYLLDAVETIFSMVPEQELALLDRAPDPEESRYRHYDAEEYDWREIGLFDIWTSALDSQIHRSEGNITDEQKVRLWNLLHWRDEPFAGALRNRPPLSVVTDAYVAGGATLADVIDQMLGPQTKGRHGDFTALRHLTARPDEDDRRLFKQRPEIPELIDRCRERILEIELARGESPTAATDAALALNSIYGVDQLVRILTAIGKEPFKVPQGYTPDHTARLATFTEMLKATFPAESDTPKYFAAEMRKLMKSVGMPEQRMLELAFHAPQWTHYVEQFLGWNGFLEGLYWFVAHMQYVYTAGDLAAQYAPDAETDSSDDGDQNDNDTNKSKWDRIIQERTPLTDEERSEGAVDVNWFHRTYALLSPKRWDAMAQAARFAANAAQAKRARFVADVLRGKVSRKELVDGIRKKNLKENVRLLGLAPLAKGAKQEADIRFRYDVLQQYRRYANQLSSLAKPDALRALEIGMRNLASLAGYPDPLRLQWALEAKDNTDLADGPVSIVKDGVSVSLALDEQAVPQITVLRGEKRLKSIPPKLRKDKKIAELSDRAKELKRQSSRMRHSLESAMCRRDEFTSGELRQLMSNAILSPQLQRLVIAGDKVIGYPTAAGDALRDAKGKRTRVKKADKLRIAHPYDLLKTGHWHDWQHECFAAERIQPFKQVFRELYVPTAQEKKDKRFSRRYAGQQINPAQGNALWGSRGWHTQEGVWKPFHDLKMTAAVEFDYGITTPLEVEGLTIDRVHFYRHEDYKSIPIKDVPPLVFSEVMRDMDLVVSVAHAGGVDPEATASTVEMRADLLRETCELLGLKNVRIKKNHVMIKGHLASYSLHLGSGVVHQMPGGSICLVPVHAQHRGRIFLPFADDDPRTAEVVSKVIMLAGDNEIQDPTFLEQLRA
eukprot:g26732.t1